MNCIDHWVITQKKFTVDFLDKKMKVNEGEVPQYYIEQSHQPIIDPEKFDMVQAEFARRKRLAAAEPSLRVSSAAIAVATMAPKFGIPTASTAAPFGSATESSAATRSVPHRIYWRRTSRSDSSPPLTSC